MNDIFLFRYYTMRGSIYEEPVHYCLRCLSCNGKLSGKLRSGLFVVEANTILYTRLTKVLTSFDDFIIYGNYVQIVSDLLKEKKEKHN